MEADVQTLQRWIDESRAIVFFGGAGVSTESGIPDFRSVDGLYNQKYAYPPEEILSHTFFKGKTEEFYRFYRDKMLCLTAQPNAAHRKLAQLEAAGKLDRTMIAVTGDHIPYFNIDVLEELAGKKFGSSDAIQALNESAIDFDVYKNTLILWSASMTQPVPVDKVCCQVDILPTLSNLLGLPYDSRMLAGRDVLSDSEGLVVFSSRSWRSDRGFYDRYARSFTPAPGWR